MNIHIDSLCFYRSSFICLLLPCDSFFKLLCCDLDCAERQNIIYEIVEDKKYLKFVPSQIVLPVCVCFLSAAL